MCSYAVYLFIYNLTFVRVHCLSFVHAFVWVRVIIFVSVVEYEFNEVLETTPIVMILRHKHVVVIIITRSHRSTTYVKVKGKGFPYSIPSVGPGADPGAQAVSLQVTVSHPPGGRLPLLSPGLRVPSQLQNITALWPVPSYTVW